MIDKIINCGLIPYADAYNLQKTLFDEAIARKTTVEKPQNVLILCGHPHVITLGKHGVEANLLFPEALLKEKNVEFFHTDRGGDITYHGPGQVVGYPIFDLESLHIGLKEHVRRMEEAIIRLLSDYDIRGERLSGASGVWIEAENPRKARKICAVGVKSSRFVTMHGFALNVNTDLSYFQLINPCGFTDKGVTSIEKEIGAKTDIEDVKKKLENRFKEIY
ncbi:MAG: lipoyl(octanoyl) transferase LipB [Dysgonamonadaceae bacterium]|jgi:lipoyl(octanoyl) transferase|nr:lipoyl(octanoyl) transferase LipB [Dysgonamonadaceae bacterium]